MRNIILKCSRKQLYHVAIKLKNILNKKNIVHTIFLEIHLKNKLFYNRFLGISKRIGH